MDQSRFALATCAKCASAYGLCGSQYGKSRGSLVSYPYVWVRDQWIAYTSSLWWFVQLSVGIPFAESGKHTIIKSRELMDLQSRHNSTQRPFLNRFLLQLPWILSVVRQRGTPGDGVQST